MSVGHVARAAESSGIPTVVICVKSFAHVAAEMGLARTIVTHHPMGRPLGAVGDRSTQRDTVEMALGLLETANESRAVVERDAPFRPVASNLPGRV